MALYKNGPGARFWTARWKHKGESISRSTRETSKKAAMAVAQRLRSEWLREQEELENAADDYKCDVDKIERCPECKEWMRGDRTLTALDQTKVCSKTCRDKWNERSLPKLGDFLDDKFRASYQNAKPATQKAYNYGVEHLLASDLVNVKLDDISIEHCEALKASLSQFAPSTVNCVLRTLRRALNLAELWGTIPHAPKLPGIMLAERERDRVVTDAEFAAYYALLGQPYKDLVLLIRFEGMRPWSEAAVLRWENVLFVNGNGLIRIIGGKSKAARRQLPLTPTVFDMLEGRYEAQGRPKTGWVFPANTASGHTDHDSCNNLHQAAMRKLEKKVAYFQPYCLRHTALTRLGEAGCDAFTLKQIAGHTSITMTQRYVHPQAEAVAQAFLKLPMPALLGKGE